jgi:cytochrome c-type biogenesis protein CcmF
MHPGSTLTTAFPTLRFVGVTESSGANYDVERAEIVVDRPGRTSFTLDPERRFFPLAGSETARTAIATNGFADLYLALGDPDGHGGWVVRAYYNPLVPWIWFGAIVAVCGGLVSLSDRLVRRRIPVGGAAVAMASSAEPG